MRLKARFQVVAPTVNSPASLSRNFKVSRAVEIADTSYDDITGDFFNVVPAAVDFSKDYISFVFRDSGVFADVPADGFNGYRISFDLPKKRSLKNVQIPQITNTVGLPASNVTYTKSEIFINVDSLSFSYLTGFVVTFDPLT
jgi:hypothetical protein